MRIWIGYSLCSMIVVLGSFSLVAGSPPLLAQASDPGDIIIQRDVPLKTRDGVTGDTSGEAAGALWQAGFDQDDVDPRSDQEQGGNGAGRAASDHDHRIVMVGGGCGVQAFRG